jgi:hypothetical protein
MKILDVRDGCAGVDELLAKTVDPRHRAILKNYRRHVILEVSGRWQELLTPEMLTTVPRYRIDFGGQNVVLNGFEPVIEMYQSATAAGTTTFGPLEERLAVADWGIALESHMAHHQRGHELQAMGVAVDDPEGFYQWEHWVGAFWPYDEDCRLIGEHVFEDVGSRTVRPISEADFITPSKAAALLGPLLDIPTD